MSANRMQEAFVAAVMAVNNSGSTKALGTALRVYRVADKVTIRPMRDERKLSFRTFNKLKDEGIVE